MQNRLLKLAARRGGRRLRPAALATVTAIAALALPTSASAAGRFKIVVHIANHRPTAGKRWPIELVVTHGHRRLSGTVRYQFMFAGVVVRTQPQHGAFRFRHGVYRDQLIFPRQSVGQPLTLRFLVRTRYGTERADWKLETRR